MILRGGSNGTNYDAESIGATQALLDAQGIETGVMVDMSHANSEKDHNKQLNVCTTLCDQLQAGDTNIVGVMIESNLVAGRQDMKDPTTLTYGQSITDACIGWEDSEQVLNQLYAAVQTRFGA